MQESEETADPAAINQEIMLALKEKLSDNDIEGQVKAIVEEHHWLIPKSAAAVLLAARLGVLKRKEIALNEIKKGDRNFRTCAFVERIFPTYAPKDDMSAKSVRVVICDSAQKNSMTAVMWGANALLAENGLSINDQISLDGCSYRNGEINCYSGCIVQIIGKSDFSSVKNLKYGLVNIKGVVSEIFQDYYYMRNGKEQYMSSFKLTQHDGSMRIVAWHDPTVVKKLQLGATVACENCLFKNNEIHINAYSRLVSFGKKLVNSQTGAITSIAEKEGKLLVGTEMGEIEILEAQVLKFLGFKELPEGVTLHVSVDLKRNSLIGKRIICQAKEHMKEQTMGQGTGQENGANVEKRQVATLEFVGFEV